MGEIKPYLSSRIELSLMFLGQNRPMRPLRKVKIAWSPEFAYAIGLITSDGNLSSNGRSVNLTSKDAEVIETFKNCLCVNNKAGLKGNGASNHKKYFFLQIGDKVFYEFLLSIGLMPAKSKVLAEVLVPREYFSDFLRGCIDGDGSIGYYAHPESRWPQLRIRLTSGSPKFLHWIKDEVAGQFKIQGGWIQKPHQGVSVLAYASADSIRLASYLYPIGVNCFLKRKYDVIVKYKGRVAELVQAHGLGPCSARNVGSNPTSPTR